MNIRVDFDKALGRIKPMHAVGQPPTVSGAPKDTYFHYLTEAHIPFSRLHDVGGGYGMNRYVDIPNIFRDFDADENDPASYDFAFTDWLIAALYKADCAPIFRLGVTIENYVCIKRYFTFPPKDYAKWARVCEHIIRHYNEGWADGFSYGIEYWEIWNEPENGETPEKNQMWCGTDEQYFELYTVTAKHLKACFGDTVKVGGYGSCGFYNVAADPKAFGIDAAPVNPNNKTNPDHIYRTKFLDGFFAYIKQHGAPLDFFSWHSYTNVEGTLIFADFVDKKLREYGYENVETQLNEWNNAASMEKFGTSEASAKAAAMMLAMQNKKVDMLCYYDARIGTSQYGGLFYPIPPRPTATYYAFKAFGELYALGTQVSLEGLEDGVYAVAAKGEGGRAVMIANVSGEEKEIVTELAGFDVYLIDKAHALEKVALNAGRFVLENEQVALLSAR